jgi:sugar phosphate permease
MSTCSPLSLSQDALERAINKAKWRLIPFLLLLYIGSYLDRANVGFAKQAFQHDTGLSEAAFAFGAGIFFLAYALFEVPSNLIMHRVGARLWMSRIMVTWGLVAATTMFATTATSFSVVRFLLGTAEAGFFPGAILYLTYWFPARARGEVLGVFYFGGPVALMLGAPFSGWLLEFDGFLGLHGWQWMFLIEGLLASAIGVWAYFYLVDRPKKAPWLTPEEKEALDAAIAAEDAEKEAAGRVTLSSVFSDRRMLHFAAIYMLIQIAGYGVAFYLPTIVSSLLHQKVGLYVGFVSAIPWGCSLVAGYFLPRLAVRHSIQRPLAATMLVMMTLGLVISSLVSPVLAIGAFCFATMGLMAAQPMFWTFPTRYLGGIAASGGIAIINAIGNLGGFFAPNVKTWAEIAFGGGPVGIYPLALASLTAAILVAFLPTGQTTPKSPDHSLLDPVRQ